MKQKHVEEESFGIIPLLFEEGQWKVLIILHKGGNHWGFPKGHRNLHESAQQTAERELKEETGLTIERFIQDFPLVEKYQFRKKDQFVSKTVSYFPALVKGTLKLQAEEILEAKWVLLQEAPLVLSFKEARSVCIQLMKKFEI